ncbi:zinc-binding alcohol dehydrogenase family protein [Paenibacillus sp. IB182496]|uniref:Zinc-binding alcohol dehydrogenase family protein n=1 Tax=Paenibacillus sabuli TaxID=2772509 RepID=A0A927BUA2_9BACL|nr:zinc-binding alcohol dehydrogenase family protein [Paenibacillus sabuli]MBD2845644.1 zinc-binding alcohol dehydrogenase family protein [Paenibacillus sabuli]
MKQIVCEQPDRLRMEEAPVPTPQAGEALVRIRRIGICGTDMHAYKGNQPFFTYPRVLGHELAGIVEQVEGPDAGIRIGDQVAVVPYLECGRCIACRAGKTNCCTQMRVLGVHVDGGMRERIVVPADHLLRTYGLSLDQAAVLEPLSIGAHAVRRSGLEAGETVLVIGAGPIGLGVMAFARHRGAKVIAMDINEERLAFCRSWAGADEAVNALEEPLQALEALTAGDLPTVVFDATGNVRSMTDAFRYVAHGGKLVYVGLVKADLSFHDPEFHKRELTLLASRNATREDFAVVMEAVRGGAVDIARYITHRAAFADMTDRFEGWLKPESKVIKAMVELD